MKKFYVKPVYTVIAQIRWNMHYDSACVWSGLKDLTNGEFNGSSLEYFCSFDEPSDPNFNGSWWSDNFIIDVKVANNICHFDVQAISGSELKEMRIRTRDRVK